MLLLKKLYEKMSILCFDGKKNQNVVVSLTAISCFPWDGKMQGLPLSAQTRSSGGEEEGKISWEDSFFKAVLPWH